MAFIETAQEVEAREQVCEAVFAAQSRGDSTFFLTNNFVLRRLPDQIRNLKATLQILHVDNNYELCSLPAAIGELTQLRWLNVSYNKLRELPIEIGRLQRLERLHINNNQIESLPLEVWSLRNLEELRCESNQLRALPTGVLGMKLREIFADNNNFLAPIDCEEADLYEKFPKLAHGDCASCRVRFRDYVVSCTFHKIAGCGPFPIVHYCCSELCLKQLATRLSTLDSTPLSPSKVVEVDAE